MAWRGVLGKDTGKRPAVTSQDNMVIRTEGTAGGMGVSPFAGVTSRSVRSERAGSSGSSARLYAGKGEGTSKRSMPQSLFEPSKRGREESPVRDSEGFLSVFSRMPDPSTCHNFMKSCVPEDWMKKLNEKDLEELARIQSCSVLQALSVDTVMNAKAREAECDLLKFCGKMESLREKLVETKVNARERLDELRHELRVAKRAVVELNEQRGQLITQVIPHVCRQLLGSWEFGRLVVDFVQASRKWERALVLEELAASGEKVVLGDREDYDRDASRKCDAASDALARAQFPYIAQVSSSSHASVGELLAMMPRPREE